VSDDTKYRLKSQYGHIRAQKGQWMYTPKGGCVLYIISVLKINSNIKEHDAYFLLSTNTLRFCPK